MNAILDAAVEVDSALSALGFEYRLIGGIALQRWGQPRTTLDVDATVMTFFGREEPLVRQLLECFQSRIPDALEFALESRTLLLVSSGGVGIDISLGALPFESRIVDRSSLWRIDEVRQLRTCGAEDLIVLKAFAGREQDWVDVRSVVDRQADRLDTRVVLEEVEPLLVELKGTPDDYHRLCRLLQESSGGP
jgi:hypothetical protein